MKKHLLFLAASAVALTACTSEEVVDVSRTQGNAIAFENIINKSTRAGVEGDLSNTAGNFDNFLVYGYYTKEGMSTIMRIFDGISVKKVDDRENPGQKKWEYEGETRYWLPGYTYTFFAYSCGDIELDTDAGMGTPDFTNGSGTEDPTLTLVDYLCDKDHQHDLVTAKNGPYPAAPSGNQAVTLSFNHALCKAKASFVTDFPSEYHVYVSNVYLSSFNNKGDFDVRTGVWSDWKGSETNPTVNLYLPANSYVQSSGDTNHASVTTGEAFLIPKIYDDDKNETVQLHFTVTITKDGNTILEKKIVGTWSPEWKIGTIYKYSVNITGKSTGIEPIVFATEQSLNENGTWGNTQTVNMTFSPDTDQNTDEPQP